MREAAAAASYSNALLAYASVLAHTELIMMTDAPALQLAKVSKEREGGRARCVDPCYFRRQLLEARDIYGGWEGEKCIHTHTASSSTAVYCCPFRHFRRAFLAAYYYCFSSFSTGFVCVCVCVPCSIAALRCVQAAVTQPSHPTNPTTVSHGFIARCRVFRHGSEAGDVSTVRSVFRRQ